MDTILALIRVILGLAVVLLLLILTLKYLNRFTNQMDSHFKIVKKIAVTKESSLAIVLIVDTYYVMSFSEHGSEIIKELTENQAQMLLDEEEQNLKHQQEMAANFKQIFDKVRKRK